MGKSHAIAFLIRTLDQPEVSAHVFNIAELMSRASPEAEVVVLAEDLAPGAPFGSERFEAAGISVREVPSLPAPRRCVRGLAASEGQITRHGLLSEAGPLAALQKEIAPTWWHALSIELATAVRLSEMRADAEKASHVVAALYRTRQRWGDRKASTIAALAREKGVAQGITTSSLQAKMGLVEGFGGSGSCNPVAHDRAEVLPFALNVERFQAPSPAERREAREKLGIKEGPVAVLPWPFAEGQCPGLFLGALPRLRKEGVEATGLCAGPGVGAGRPAGEKSLRRMAEEEGAGSVALCDTEGGKNRFRDALWAADVAVWTAPDGRAGVPVAQSMLCEVPPVLVHANGAAGALVENGKTGAVLSSADERTLRRRLGRILRAEQDRGEMGRRAREAALKRHGRAQVVEGLCGALHGGFGFSDLSP